MEEVVASVRHSDTGEGHVITTDTGKQFRAKRVLLATGAFTHCRKLLSGNLRPKLDLLPISVIKVHVNPCEFIKHLYII